MVLDRALLILDTFRRQPLGDLVVDDEDRRALRGAQVLAPHAVRVLLQGKGGHISMGHLLQVANRPQHSAMLVSSCQDDRQERLKQTCKQPLGRVTTRNGRMPATSESGMGLTKPPLGGPTRPGSTAPRAP